MESSLDAQEPIPRVQYRVKHADGTWRWHEGSITPVFADDGSLRYFVGVSRDITEQKQAEDDIEYLSFHDALTGLYNRRFYEEELRRLDVERNLRVTLLMIDVNGLKLTNDAFGHAAGDELLKAVAKVLQATCRADDIAARIGGDEFAVLLSKTDEEETLRLTLRIREAMSSETVAGLPLSVSSGWATKTDPLTDIDDVFKEAEDHMYREKVSDRREYRHQTIELIVQTLYAKSPEEREHSERVSQLCRDIGSAMGLSQSEIDQLTMAGELHDVGKIVIDNDILDKKDPLLDSEWEQIKRHSNMGYSILSAVNDYGPLAESVLAHHERWDGSGYPHGLQGEKIPIQARIIGIADAYDAMVSDRPYRKGKRHEDAVMEIRRCAGSQFDPAVVEVFVEMMQGKEAAASELSELTDQNTEVSLELQKNSREQK